MKEISIYTHGKYKGHLPKRPGSFVTKMEYKGNVKYLDGFVEDTTTNRAIITGIIESIKVLKEPCRIHIYNCTPIGFGLILNKKGEYKKAPMKNNGDLLNELSTLLEEGGHAIKEYVTREHEKELKPLHKKYNEKYKEYEPKPQQKCSNNWSDKTEDNGIIPF